MARRYLLRLHQEERAAARPEGEQASCNLFLEMDNRDLRRCYRDGFKERFLQPLHLRTNKRGRQLPHPITVIRHLRIGAACFQRG